MNSPGDDRNLLDAAAALRSGAVSPEKLAAAILAWSADRSRPLADLLRDNAPPEPTTAMDFALREPGDDGDGDATIGAGPRGEGESRDLGDTVAWSEADSGGRLRPSTRASEGRNPEGGSGRFRVLKLHARGGLGEVYLARDAELDRTVALKEIRREFADSAALRERFVREAEINGNLEHPGIVPVYGLGTHADGRPYYAMRFVEGETLQAALDRFHAGAKGLDAPQWSIGVRALIRRYLAICDAVDYAHSRGVLHRDLKPSNILLGKFGETLIIDWGLVKLIGGDPAPAEGQEAPAPAGAADAEGSTLAGEAMGSPPFMSPEQALGQHDRLSPASDIYGLGATLYAVVTGGTPVGAGKVADILERVARGQIRPVSEVNPRVPAALEAICRKAMRLEPGDRYPTARALADDLERWLDDQPVAVYADPPSKRLLRWSRRHRPLVAATMALMAASVVGLGVITLVVNDQRGRAEAARVQAEAARQRANEHLRDGLEVFDQLVTLGDRQLLSQANPARRAQFLAAASHFIHSVRVGEPGNLALQTWTASVARRLANLHRLTGNFAAGDPFYDEARAVLADVAARSPKPENLDLLAETLIDQGDSWMTRGKVARAEELFSQALDIARRDAKAAPRSPAYARTLSRAAVRLASAHRLAGKPDAAGLALAAVEAIKPQADAALPTVRPDVLRGEILPLTDQLELAQALYTRAEALEAQGDRRGAERCLEDARRRVADLKSRLDGLDVAEVDYFLAWIGTRLARLLAADPGGRDASGLLDDAAQSLARLGAAHPEFPHFRASLAEARLAIAAIAEAKGEDVRARESAEAARSAASGLVAAYPEVPEYASLLAESLAVLSRVGSRGGPEDRDLAAKLLAEATRVQAGAVAASPDIVDYRERLRKYRDALDAASQAPPPR